MTDVEPKNEFAAHSLELVHHELNATLDSARQEIEEFVDGQASVEALSKAAGLLHLASGALRIVEIHGAALLADEMEQTCKFLVEGNEPQAAEKGVQALTRAMIQLPAYLDRLLSGGRDVALVLLPLLNDLRAVRGKPLMSEGTLLLLKTGPLERSSRIDGRGQSMRVDDEFARLAQRQRPGFQAALLGWIRGEHVERNLDELILISTTLEQAATAKYVQQFWSVLAAIFVALRADGLEPSVALKRLIGQADRQLKRLADGGEVNLAGSPPADLLNNLLYYVARANCDDQRVNSVRSEFGLHESIPGDGELERARESLAGPSVKLMRTVAIAIKQDLGVVKDNLDIFVRTGMQDYRQLLPQLEMLTKIGDTLSVLGLERAQKSIQSQVTKLNAIAQAGSDVGQDVLERVAAVILSVEDDLDEELVRAVVPADESDENSEAEAQYSQVTQAVMSECIANMARVKEAVAKLVDSPQDTRPLEQIAPQLRGIAAGLLMLNKTAAVRLIERVGKIVKAGVISDPGAAEAGNIERLADAIVSIEYYMETVSAGRKDPWYMLENAARCLDLLERRAREKVVAAEPVVSERPADVDRREEPATAHERQTAAPGMRVLADGAGLDPELLEIFIEEAKEEIENINENLPVWIKDQSNGEALIRARRSFHTLKGSGRTVGAEAIGEFSWSVENLLNRLINRTLRATEPMLALIQDAAGVLPELIDQLELGIEPKSDFDELRARADAFAAGESVEIGAVEPTEPLEEAREGAEIPAPTIDPVLAEIFVKEVRGHLQTLRQYLDAAERAPVPPAVDEPLYRASHTLLGSANMANYRPCILVAEPLSQYLQLCYQNHQPVSDVGLSVLIQAADVLGTITEALAAEELIEPPSGLVNALRTLVESTAEQVEEAEPASDTATGERQIVEEPTDAGVADAISFDPEIAAIFTDEATEILDQAEFALQRLRDGRDVSPGLTELQRLLHTLKGGARMAGIVQMADLSHALETQLASMANGRRPADAAAVDVIQRTLDSLQTMRDCVDTGRVFPDSSSLLDELQPAPIDQISSIVQGPDIDSRPFADNIREQTINRPLDFDLTHPGHAPTDRDGMTTRVLPQLDGEPDLSVDAAGMELEQTGTTEFSDEQLAQLQQLAFEQGLDQPPDTEPHQPEIAEAADSEADLIEPGRGDLQLADAGQPRESELTADDAVAPQVDVSPPPDSGLIIEAAEIDSAEPAESGGFELAVEQPEERAGQHRDEFAPAASADAVQDEPDEGVLADAGTQLTVDDTLEGAIVATADGDAHRAAPASTDAVRAADRTDVARVDAELLDALLNSSGEISIFQARLNQQLHSIEFHLSELGQTVTRLREQLRKLEAETEAEILHRHHDDTATNVQFDPLELDRYSTIQQLSRALAETANDVASINELLTGLTTEADTLLMQQGRVTAEIQDGLMQTRMVAFQRHVPRLARVVRQAAADNEKSAELHVYGATSELDRQVLDSMLPAFEHLLRNCVVHGIEAADRRLQLGKPATGQIHLKLTREGSEVSIELSDDGAGLNVEAIRRTALEQGLIRDGEEISERQAAELILQPGFSTARELTQTAGRGVGMDVVENELKRLGGSMQVESTSGSGTRFLIRLPYTLAITHALVVDVGDETFALPLTTVEGITRVRREHLLDLLTQDDPKLDYGDHSYRLQHLGSLVGAAPSALPEDESAVALVLVRAGQSSTALLTDNLEGSREVVVKGLGPHIASIAGVTGATILGDGRVVMILDVGTLIRQQSGRTAAAPVIDHQKRALTALVVDDSITMRRVTERLLGRRGINVVTARDGLDAVSVLQESDPDIILLDIEMPRMDGYQFAAHVRNDRRFKDLPIIMITSRSGQKHRAKAIELGVNEYLSKPYQEAQLFAAMESLLGTEL